MSTFSKNHIRIRRATIKDVHEIYEILSESFKPYHQYYTPEAYQKTVNSPIVIKKRIMSQKKEVLVVTYRKEIVGTASLTKQRKGRFHIRSMAVKPNYQNKGIGKCILEKIDKIAKEGHTKIISLECFEPLTNAIGLYERLGYRRTDKKRNYHGISIFEMIKELK
ncbi:MAG: GNAT family N-acetyltransferase [Candidatus Hodarchaeota archaeon]